MFSLYFCQGILIFLFINTDFSVVFDLKLDLDPVCPTNCIIWIWELRRKKNTGSGSDSVNSSPTPIQQMWSLWIIISFLSSSKKTKLNSRHKKEKQISPNKFSISLFPLPSNLLARKLFLITLYFIVTLLRLNRFSYLCIQHLVFEF